MAASTDRRVQRVVDHLKDSTTTTDMEQKTASAATDEDDGSVKIVLGTMDFGRFTSEEDSVKMMDIFLKCGFTTEIDTALLYAGGKSEEILGRMDACKGGKTLISSKVNPWSDAGLKYDRVIEVAENSLKNLNVDKMDIFYLHAPDHNTPIEETLRAINDLHKRGVFDKFGLSNFSSWETVRAWWICKSNGWVLPTVYQGMYAAITREVERELFPALRAHNISFYAYSPLGGGILSGRHTFQLADNPDNQPAGRFFQNNWAETYRSRYWFKDNFDAMDNIKAELNKCYGDGKVSLAEASVRWVLHHSGLSGKYGDALVIGASKLHHLESNLGSCNAGPLEQSVVDAFENLWTVAKHHCPSYFR